MQIRTITSEDDVIIEADSGATGAPGDLILKVAGVERARIRNDGTGTGLFGGSITPLDLVVPYAQKLPFLFKSRGSLIFDNVVGGAYTSKSLKPKRIIRDSSTSPATYYVPYTGTGDTGRTMCMLSTQVPPDQWKAYADSGQTIFTDLGVVSGLPNPSDHVAFVQQGINWFAFLGSSSDLQLYKSTNGTLLGPYTSVTATLVKRGPTGRWDAGTVYEPFVWQKPDGSWAMLYMGENGASTTEQIGYATAPAGDLTTAVWTKAGTVGTCTITIASPGVVSKTAHGLVAGDAVFFSTTGALPTGLTAGTTYYVISAGLTADAFEVSTSVGGSAVNTSGSQSGTHTVSKANVNPVLPNGAAGTFDSTIVADPFVWFDSEGVARIYYAAVGDQPAPVGDTQRASIGCATTTDFVTFTKLGPVIDPPAWPARDSVGIWRGAFYQHTDGYVYYPRAGTNRRVSDTTNFKSQIYLDVIHPISFAGKARGNPWYRVQGEATDARLKTSGVWTTITVHPIWDNNGAIFATAANAYCEFKFLGTGVRWASGANAVCGITQVYIDGVLVATVDLNNLDTAAAGTAISKTFGYETTSLPYGEHVIKILCTGTGSAGSTNTATYVDYFEYLP